MVNGPGFQVALLPDRFLKFKNMNAKEKAKLLVYGFREYAKDLVAKDYELRYSKDEETDNAKQCALVCVDELIKEHTWKLPLSWNIKREAFWQEVKKEIEKL